MMSLSPRELPLVELILTAMIMLVGVEGKDFDYYGADDQEWWTLRLWLFRN